MKSAIVNDDGTYSVIMSKETFLQFLNDQDRKVKETDNQVESKTVASMDNPLTNSDVLLEVTKILSDLGIPRNIKGFNFLREAIVLSVQDKSYLDKMTKRLYPKIASIYETLPSRAERAIRHAIEVSFSRGNINTLNSLFTTQSGSWKVTNGDFIATISDNIRLRLKSQM